jgi:hypothetical protein
VPDYGEVILRTDIDFISFMVGRGYITSISDATYFSLM